MIYRNEFKTHLGKVFAFMDKASGEGLHFADDNFPDNDLEASDIVVDLATALNLELIDCADIPASITEAVLAALSPTPAADEVEAVARAIQREAQDNRNDSPVDYGDAEALAKVAIAAMQTGSAEPAAPISDGEIYSRTSFDSADHKRGFLEGMGFAASTEPEGDAQMTAVRAGEVWGDTVGGWEDSAMAAARVIEAYGDRRVADALKAAEHAGEEPAKHGPGCGSHNDYPCDCPRPATPTNPERLVEAVSFDMDAAPKDGKILLWIPEEDRTHLVKAGYWIRGQWDDNRYAKKPKPYWSTDDERIVGTIDRRKNQPTAWMPLPAAPLKEGQGE